MTMIDAATRMAYVDGELDEVARRRVERAMAEDPVPAEAVARDRALRERLQADFAPYAEEPAPDRFRALLDTNAVPVAGPSRAATWPAATRRWAQAATIAATLILGVATGYPLSAPGPVAIRSGALVAHGRLAAALDSGISPGPQLERVPQPTAKPPLAF